MVTLFFFPEPQEHMTIPPILTWVFSEVMVKGPPCNEYHRVYHAVDASDPGIGVVAELHFHGDRTRIAERSGQEREVEVQGIGSRDEFCALPAGVLLPDWAERIRARFIQTQADVN